MSGIKKKTSKGSCLSIYGITPRERCIADLHAIIAIHRISANEQMVLARIITGAIPGNRDRPLFLLARQWGERFPVRAAGFATEFPPAREVLAESRTPRGTGAAGVATVGAAAVEVAQEVLAEAQDAVLPLVPYLDTLRWLFIALAPAGIGVAVWARVDDWKKGRR